VDEGPLGEKYRLERPRPVENAMRADGTAHPTSSLQQRGRQLCRPLKHLQAMPLSATTSVRDIGWVPATAGVVTVLDGTLDTTNRSGYTVIPTPHHHHRGRSLWSPSPWTSCKRAYTGKRRITPLATCRASSAKWRERRRSPVGCCTLSRVQGSTLSAPSPLRPPPGNNPMTTTEEEA